MDHLDLIKLLEGAAEVLLDDDGPLRRAWSARLRAVAAQIEQSNGCWLCGEGEGVGGGSQSRKR